MKQIDEKTLDALLFLSRLSPESANLATLKKQVAGIVDYFKILESFDSGENPYDAYPSTQAENLRQGDVLQSLEIRDLKKMTGEFLDGYFRVPKVL